MGAYGFDQLPAHSAAVPARHQILAEAMAGMDEGWDIPVALWNAPTGFDSRDSPDDHPHHIVSLTLSGAMVRRVRPSGAETEREPFGSPYLCFQQADSDIRFLCEGPKRFGHLYLRPQLLTRVAREVHGDRFDGELSFYDNAFIRTPVLHAAATGYFERALDPVEPPSALEMDARAALLSIEIIRAHTPTADRAGPMRLQRGGLAPWQVRRTCAYLDEHLGRQVRLAELAALVGVSAYHFCRAFKRSTGETPHEWLTRHRIERAKSLLARHPDMPLTQVALCIGYSTQSAFATAFRRVTGTTPSVWRRERLS